MRRFYVAPDNLNQDRVTISGDEARHIAVVLRLKPGDVIGVFDGSGYEYQISLSSVDSNLVVGRVLSRTPAVAEPPVTITLVQGLAKGEKMDYIIQKSVELGVSRIIPIQTEHSVVKLDSQKAENRIRRWNRLALEACKQCGRSQPPPVEEVSGLSAVLKRFSGMPGIFFYEGCKEMPLGALIKEHRRAMLERGTVIYIGPEGGFSGDEAQLAADSGVMFAGLGPRTLRTETAGLAALSILMYELGDLGGCSAP